jgi:hypothetical protein
MNGGYESHKMSFLRRLFGPTMGWLEEIGVSVLAIPLLLATAVAIWAITDITSGRRKRGAWLHGIIVLWALSIGAFVYDQAWGW